MKKILYIVVLLLSFLIVYPQTWPVTSNLGSPSTILNIPANGAIRGIIGLRGFADTTAVNALTYIRFTPFVQIATGDGQVWIRNSDATRWLPMGADFTFENGLTETSDIVRWGGTLTQSTVITQASNPIRFNDGNFGLNLTGNPLRRLSIGNDIGSSTTGNIFIYASDNTSAFFETSGAANLAIRSGNSLLLSPNFDDVAGQIVVGEVSGNNLIEMAFLGSGANTRFGKMGLEATAEPNKVFFYLKTEDTATAPDAELALYGDMRFLNISQNDTLSRVLMMRQNGRVEWRNVNTIGSGGSLFARTDVENNSASALAFNNRGLGGSLDSLGDGFAMINRFGTVSGRLEFDEDRVSIDVRDSEEDEPGSYLDVQKTSVGIGHNIDDINQYNFELNGDGAFLLRNASAYDVIMSDTADGLPLMSLPSGRIAKLNRWPVAGGSSFTPITVTSSMFASPTEYNDPRIVGLNVRVFLNELGRFLDSTTEVSFTPTGIEILLPGFDAASYNYNLIIYQVTPGITAGTLPFNLTYPANMEGQMAFRVRRREDLDTFYTTYDWDAVADGITGTEMYVDPVLGNDANPGTIGSPKKSISWVIDNSTASICYVTKFFNYPEAFNGADIDRPMKFIAYGGIAYVTTSDVTGAWSGVVGNPGAFESTYSGPAAIESPVACDFNNKDIYGNPIRMTPVASIALVASTPNSVFADPTANKFYVHTFDSRTPDDSVRCFFEKNSVESLTAHDVVFENIVFMGGGSSGRALAFFDNPNDAIQRNIVFKNCRILYALYDGTANLRNMNGYYLNTIFAYNGQDGNDWDDYNITGLEENCVGYRNGYDASDANNGSTAHDRVKLVRVNCVYKYNQGRNVHDIEDATSYNVNIVCDSSTATTAANYAFGTSSPGSLNTTMYFMKCVSDEDKGWDIRTTNGHGLFYSTNKASTTNNFVGTVTDLSGYQFAQYPIVLSATVVTSTSIEVVFSSPVTATNVGWSFAVNGVSQTPSAISGSGTNTLTFTVTTIISSDVVTRTYGMGPGDVTATNGQPLISFNINPVTVGI